MANTPEPCVDCGWLYADALSHNNPSYSAECVCPKDGCKFGQEDCPNFEHWEKLRLVDQPVWKTYGK